MARLARFRLDDRVGLPRAEPWLERLGEACMLAATLWLFGVGVWEIGAPFSAGHYAAATAVLTGAENMLRFGVIAPVNHVISAPPSPSDYYCHHPFGIFWTAVPFAALFGHHAWVCRLPAVLMTGAMPWLVYRGTRAALGPVAGGVAALGYSVLPITLAYAQFFALEVPVMFGMALATWALVRFFQAGSQRYAVLALFGLGYASAADWPGMLFAGLVLAALFLRGFALRRFYPTLPFERFAVLWSSAVGVLGLVVAFHLAALVKLDQLGELLRQGEFRSLGASRPLSETLAARHYWIALAFTPLAVAMGKLALPVLIARAVLVRRELELVVLAIFATAAAQYVVFKQGADIHFFWPQYFALYFAYAFGALTATLEAAG